MKAMVIAGSCPQIVLLKQLKERGFQTVLADNNENAVARPYADQFVKVNILDFEAVERIAEAGGYSIIMSLQQANAILWYSQSVDITDQVINSLIK